MNRYYSIYEKDSTADIYIFDDVTSDSEPLAEKIAELDVNQINVHINSYGGEVAEGLAIYNALIAHKAKVMTMCEGFACSIASVIFMAGEQRIMRESSLLMIHNAWTLAVGNSKELRKTADDLDIISQAASNVYLGNTSLDDEAIKAMLDAETWINPSDALSFGFATGIVGTINNSKAAASVSRSLFSLLKKSIDEQKKMEFVPNEAEKPQEQIEEQSKENKLLKFFDALK